MDVGNLITKLKALGYKENKVVVYTGLGSVMRYACKKETKENTEMDSKIREKYIVLVKEPKTIVILENKYMLKIEANAANLMIDDKELGLLSLYHDFVYMHDERIVYDTKDKYAILYRFGHMFKNQVFMKDGICLMGKLGPLSDSYMYILSKNKFYNVYRIEDNYEDEDYEHDIVPVSFSWVGTDIIEVHTEDGKYVICTLIEMNGDDSKDFRVHKLEELAE